MKNALYNDTMMHIIILVSQLVGELHCNSNPCRNGASCFNLNLDYFCQCTKGWQVSHVLNIQINTHIVLRNTAQGRMKFRIFFIMVASAEYFNC